MPNKNNAEEIDLDLDNLGDAPSPLKQRISRSPSPVKMRNQRSRSRSPKYLRNHRDRRHSSSSERYSKRRHGDRDRERSPDRSRHNKSSRSRYRSRSADSDRDTYHRSHRDSRRHSPRILGAAVAVTPVIIHVKEKKNLKCVRLKLVTFTAVKFQKLLSLDSLSESKTKSVLR